MMDLLIAMVIIKTRYHIKYLLTFAEFCSVLCAEVTMSSKGKKKKSKDNANRIKEESERNDSSRSESLKTLSKG